MSFFKDVGKKFESATGLSVERVALAGMTAGGSELHTLGGGDKLIDFINDPTGAKKQARKNKEALERAAGEERTAAQLQYDLGQEQLEFARSLYDEQAPFREAALSLIPRLQDELSVDYESPTFRRELESGMESLQGSFAQYGLQDSTVSAEASADLVSQLKTNERVIGEDRRRALLAMLLGGREAGVASTIGAQGVGAQFTGVGAQLSRSAAQSVANAGMLGAQGSVANRQFLLQAGMTAAPLLFA